MGSPLDKRGLALPAYAVLSEEKSSCSMDPMVEAPLSDYQLLIWAGGIVSER